MGMCSHKPAISMVPDSSFITIWYYLLLFDIIYYYNYYLILSSAVPGTEHRIMNRRGATYLSLEAIIKYSVNKWMAVEGWKNEQCTFAEGQIAERSMSRRGGKRVKQKRQRFWHLSLTGQSGSVSLMSGGWYKVTER